MIRKLFLLILFATCSYSLFGQSSFYHRMETAIDIGTYDSEFFYEGTFDTRKFSNDYVLPSYKEPDFSFGNEIFFKLTLTRSMDVGIGINGPSEVGTFAHILDVTGKEVDRLNLGYADLCISLLPGTYYIVAESMDYGAGKVVEEGLIYLYIYIDEREIGEDFYYPMDLGTFGSEFTVSHTDNITEYISDYEPGADNHDDYHDMVYCFTLQSPVRLTLENSSEYCHTLLKRWEDDVVEPIYAASENLMYYDLEPGIYYIHTWALGWGYTWQTVSLTGTPIPAGSSFSSPTDIVGEYYGTAFYYDHTFDTSVFVGSKMSFKAGSEVYYRVTFTQPISLDVCNCDSEVNDTYLMVYSLNQELLYVNDVAWGRGACDNGEHAYLQIPYLSPGTYYIVVDGSTNGKINLFINGVLSGPVGDDPDTAIDAGTYGLLFTDTRDTSLYGDRTSGFISGCTPFNDVFYKFTLTSPMDLRVSHCGSVLSETHLGLLDSTRSMLYSSADSCEIKVDSLPAGTYYIVSEGNSANGFITTNLETLVSQDSLSPTSTQPYVLSYVPTVATDDVLSLADDEVRHEIQYYDHFGNPTAKVQHGFSPWGMT